MMPSNWKPKVCIITTVDLSLDKLFPGFYALLVERGYEVVGICADGPFVDNVRKQGARVIVVPMTRQFTPIRDLKCLWMIYRIFKREKFDIIHYSTPKAELLSAIAGRLLRCPVLAYTLRGTAYTGFSGLKRLIGKICVKIACRSAHCVIVISNSLREEAVRERLSPADHLTVLGAGSSKGVDIEQFQLSEQTIIQAQSIRQDLGIGTSDIVIGYAGRLTKEKGIVELVAAFGNIRKTYGNIHMILVGDQDQRSPLPDEVIGRMSENANIHSIPFTDDLAGYMAATDIFVLPTYRDGFGNVLIEAAALEKPVIGTDVFGARDALQNGINGILVRARDVGSLENALVKLIENPAQRIEMGRNGKQWVRENFDRKIVWERLIEVYEQMLAKAGKEVMRESKTGSETDLKGLSLEADSNFSQERIVPLRGEHVVEVSRLHLQGLGKGIMSWMGEQFVQRFYHALVESGLGFGFVAVQGDRVVGFVSCAENANAVYRFVLKKNFFRSVRLAFSKHFRINDMRDTIEKLFHLSHTETGLPSAEILAVVVAQQACGRGVGSKLIKKACDEFRKRGIERVKVVAGELKRADGFYRELGFEFAGQFQHRRRGLVSRVYVREIFNDSGNTLSGRQVKDP